MTDTPTPNVAALARLVSEAIAAYTDSMISAQYEGPSEQEFAAFLAARGVLAVEALTDTPTPNVAALARILAKVLEFNSYDFATPRAMRAVCEELAAAGVLAVEALTDAQCETIGDCADDYGFSLPKPYEVRDLLARLARGET